MAEYLSTDPNAGLETEYLSTDPNAGLEAPDHSAKWNADQQAMRDQAAQAGLPPVPGSRERLIDAINREQQAGYPVQHFIGQPNEPTGDRAPTMDIESLVNSFRAREARGDTSAARERAYWEQQAAQGMSADQWRSQTGEDDPRYPRNAPAAPPASSDAYMPTSILSPQEEKQSVVDFAQAHPAAENAAQAGAEMIGGMIPHDPYQYMKMLYPPLAVPDQAREMMQGNFRSVPFVGRIQDIQDAEQTPAYSKERFSAAGKTLMDLGLLGMGGEAPRPSYVVSPAVKFGTPEGLAYLKEQRALQEYTPTLGGEAPGWAQLRGQAPQAFPEAAQAFYEPAPNVDAAVRESMAQPPKAETAPPAEEGAERPRLAEAANVAVVAPEQAAAAAVKDRFDAALKEHQDAAHAVMSAEQKSGVAPKGLYEALNAAEKKAIDAETALEDAGWTQGKNAQDEWDYLPPKQPLQPEPAASTIQTPDELSSSQAQAGQRDTALRAEPEPAAVGGAGAGEGAEGGRGAAAGTSNRQNVETYGKGAVPSGTGVDTGQLLDSARAAIRSGDTDPYSVLSRTREKGVANPEEYAALAAEHERLVNDAVAKEKAGDPAAQEAAQAANDFANAIQPHKTAASDLFRLMQGDLNYDLSTSFGIDQYMKSELGRGLKPADRPAFEQRARGIRQAETGVADAVARSDARVQGRYRNVRDIPMEDAAARVREWLSDCVV